MSSTIELKIKRRDRPEAPPRWEEFAIEYRPNMNVISCLMEIQKRPMTRSGARTAPVNFEASCLEEVCGSCTMLINGRPRQACSTLVDKTGTRLELAPLSKFPVVRDLVVDRSSLFERFRQVKAWVPIDGTYNLGPGPRLSPADQDFRYLLSRCMSCACCMEACPQVNDRSPFLGPATLNQVLLMITHPTGALNKEERLEAIMGPGGLGDCGDAQNCVRACPKEIPLTTSIAQLNREATSYAVRRWLKR
ncbi:MAG: succinate dehydrogenase iron-sulfur subunit [Acidobacteria bacterium]|nr:succinate dehydrogenase iron-sulfur subunit [Acidobacteriota bacterium]